MDSFERTPINVVEELLEQLPTIERRRHLPTAELKWLVSGFMGDNGSDPDAHLPRYALVENVPGWIGQDIKAGIQLGVFSQEFVTLLNENLKS